MSGRFHVSTDERRALELRRAILVYEGHDDVYATVHPVNCAETPPMLGPGARCQHDWPFEDVQDADACRWCGMGFLRHVFMEMP